MKTNILFFVSVLSSAFLSGCVAARPGSSPIVRSGAKAFEGVVRSPLGGKGSFTVSLDTIVIANENEPGTFVDFYEQSRLVWQGIPSGGIREFSPASAFRNHPVVFRSVAYSLDKDGNKVNLKPYSQTIYINQSYGPITVAWNVGKNGAYAYSQNMYSY
ncbi:MAG TPA: hypothetical protein VHE10_01710 [Candidatus Paceibacterota bacterium]|nr:hypothetical protein [Candidatus Paceibacterota bacterium]